MSLVCVSPKEINSSQREKITRTLPFDCSFKTHECLDSFALSITFSSHQNSKNKSLKHLIPELHSYLSMEKIDSFSLSSRTEIPHVQLAVFDMDSTLIQQEVIDEMASFYGVGDKVKEITHKAMNNEIDFNESLKQRIALLKGFKKKHLDDITNHLTFNEGVKTAINFLQTKKIKTAVISGGFDFFAQKIKEQLKLDYAFANTLEFEKESLTGHIVSNILNAQKKKEILLSLAKELHIPIEKTLAVGDGANDIPMLSTAGLGLTYHAKEKVKNIMPYNIQYGDMRTLSFFLKPW